MLFKKLSVFFSSNHLDVGLFLKQVSNATLTETPAVSHSERMTNLTGRADQEAHHHRTRVHLRVWVEQV